MKNYESLNDNELLEKIRGGDNGALDFLLNKYKNMVRGKARTLFLIGGDRDDLIQEGMIGLYGAIRDYKIGSGSFAGFADLCITRRIYKAIESANSSKNLPLNDFVPLYRSDSDDEENDLILEKSGSADTGNPEEELLQREADEKLFDRIKDELSSMEYRVLTGYLDNESYADIAQKLGIPEKSVDNAIQRIRKKLKKIL